MGSLFDDFRADARFGRARLRLGLAR